MKISIDSTVTQQGPCVHLALDDLNIKFSPNEARGLAMALLTNAENADTMAALLRTLTGDIPEEFKEDRLPIGTVRRIMHSMMIQRNKMETQTQTSKSHQAETETETETETEAELD